LALTKLSYARLIGKGIIESIQLTDQSEALNLLFQAPVDSVRRARG